jgi:hypothetical protein
MIRPRRFRVGDVLLAQLFAPPDDALAILARGYFEPSIVKIGTWRGCPGADAGPCASMAGCGSA